MLQNWIQFVVVFLFVAGPVIGRVLQWAAEQRKAKARERAMQEAQLEALRTGQPLEQAVAGRALARAQVQPTAPMQQTASERMQELARRRQEQLQELRRRQQMARQQQQQQEVRRQEAHQEARTPPRMAMPQRTPTRPPGAGTPPRPTVPGRTAPQAPAQARARPTPQRPAPRPAPAQPRGAPPTPRPSLGTAPPMAAPPPMKQPAAPAPLPTAPPATVQSAAGSRSPQVTLLGQAMSRDDWRRFIVAREIFDPPISLRLPHGPGLSE